MGLDIILLQVNKERVINDLSFDNKVAGKDILNKNDIRTIGYWRNNYDLRVWLEMLYYGKGGKNRFDHNVVRVVEKDIDKLIDDVYNNKDMDPDKGRISLDDESDYLDFMELVKNALKQGYALYFESSM